MAKLPLIAVTMLLWTAAQAQTPKPQPGVTPEAALHGVDTNNDGTIDLDEARKAAKAKFMALDTDHDGTVDVKELVGTLGPKAVERTDKDKDGTLDETEYLAIVEARFKKADTNHDGTLDVSELKTPQGKDFLKLIQY